MECSFSDRMRYMQSVAAAYARGEEAPPPPMACRLSVAQPQESAVEKSLDKANTVLNLLSSESLLGTLLAPLSIAGGLFSLGKAQNVSGREAHFKAMAMDAAVHYVAIRGGRVPPADEFPTVTEAAVGQRILGTNDLSATFHNARERRIFEKTYRDAVETLVHAYKTPQGRKEILELVEAYRAWGRKHPTSASAGFFLRDR